MKMTRTIKFNIKQFIEEYIFAIECKDDELEEGLLHDFNLMFSRSNRSVQEGVYKYLQNSKLANEYNKLVELQSKIGFYFTQLDTLLES